MAGIEFTKTRNNFREATNCDYPLSYEEWMALPEDKKVAALFVNFFDTITLAWYKAQAEYIEENDGISLLMQYLLKNIPILKENPKKYNEKYIYSVSWNSMASLRRVKGAQDRFNLTTSQYASNDTGDEFDLFSTLPDSADITEHDEVQAAVKGIMDIYFRADDATKEVISHIVNGTKIGKRTQKKEAGIIEALKKELLPFKSAIIPDAPKVFAEVLTEDDYIASAVVKMRDGESAVYYGEKRISQATGKTEVVFFGAKTDYVLPIDLASTLEVLDIERY